MSGRLVHQRPDSAACFTLIKNWMKERLSEHRESCPYNENSALPTRIVDVGLPTSRGPYSGIRVVEPRETGIWVSLSHCWGSRGHFITTSTNLMARRRFIDFHELPRTFQDAFTVTRRLGFRYLWIDSLCIIQDNHQYWAQEAARMHLYYKNAALTIAVNFAAGDDEGFLHIQRSNEPTLAVLPITSPQGQHSSGVISFPRSQPDRVFVRKARERIKEPLDTRGWTLQEIILSPRTIHYTSRELRWECQRRVAFESDLNPRGYDYGYAKKKLPSSIMQHNWRYFILATVADILPVV